MADSKTPPAGRLTRLGKLASLSARVSTGFAARAAARVMGRDPDALEKQATERLVNTLGELKGAAMKLGQAMSMDSEALPPELRAVLSRLQNEAPALPWSEIEKVLRSELDKSPGEAFAEIDEKPVAAASLGQVHRAFLHDGREVAVKVQYPGIAEAIKSDFINLGLLAGALGKASKSLDMKEYYEEFRREVSLETDYQREAVLLGQYQKLMRPFPQLFTPEVVPSHSTAKVLTLTFVRGQSLSAFAASDVDNAGRMRVSEQLIQAIYGPFLMGGEVHADPHPGNFLVTPDGRLAVLDFGSVKTFSPSFVGACRDFYRRALTTPEADLVDVVKRAGFRVELEDAVARPVLQEIHDLALQSVATHDYDYATDKVSSGVRELAVRHRHAMLRIRPPAEGTMFARAIGGCSQNLRVLGGRGDFRAIYEKLLPMIP
jgi:predicted unusual protein kinase regulating ubiquinone biosynthesis (AarF/ABC1/UbiB family)